MKESHSLRQITYDLVTAVYLFVARHYEQAHGVTARPSRPAVIYSSATLAAERAYGCYVPRNRTIILRDQFDPFSDFDCAILVHEMTHHFQICCAPASMTRAEKEAEAYAMADTLRAENFGRAA